MSKTKDRSRELETRAINQMGQAANNFSRVNHADTCDLYEHEKRERARLICNTLHALQNVVLFGRAYLPQLEGNVTDLAALVREVNP